MIRIQQLKLNPGHSRKELLKKAAKSLQVKSEHIKQMNIVKESIDARKKDGIKIIYTVDITIEGMSQPDEENLINKICNNNIMLTLKKSYKFPESGSDKLKHPPIIIGTGPAGLFCALFLARNNYRPIVIERGEAVDDRIKTVEHFWNTNELNTSSNIQFGEGGAGTFSDGKLNTMVKDKFLRNRAVLEEFVKAGAPEHILYMGKPHIGTDILVNVVKNIRKEIISLGGEVRFNTVLTDLIIEDGSIAGIKVLDKEKKETVIDTETVILAIGHSARDTFEMLDNKDIPIEKKAFAVGVRVEHPQSQINISQYGKNYHSSLPTAAYKLTSNLQNKRGVYSFCMCPGGYVVNASSQQNMTAVNGMSYSKRDSANANSAIVVTVSPTDFKNDGILSGMYFQQQLETAAYRCGNGNIPVQLFKDFCDNKKSIDFGEFGPCIKGKYELSNLREIFPEYINQSLMEGMKSFERSIKGYARPDAILSGVESRTSSPIRIVRNEVFESEIGGLYPCGEGAGYAGGITSAAMDGMKVAEAVAVKYKAFS